MKALSEKEITEFLSLRLTNWRLDRGLIRREFKFKNFVEAFSFMTAVALEAEKMDHHPDWSNVYNNVVINLMTHSASGVTNLDLKLAQAIDGLFEKYSLPS
jgi:4a-hydroxytetrahydrobiopterin dehydratase